MKNIIKKVNDCGFNPTRWLKPFILVLAGLASLPPAAQGQLLFSDNFSRTTNPAPITPWLIPASAPGSWEINGGTMQSGADTPNSYAYVYVTNVFTNNSVQAQFRFSTTTAWA